VRTLVKRVKPAFINLASGYGEAGALVRGGKRVTKPDQISTRASTEAKEDDVNLFREYKKNEGRLLANLKLSCTLCARENADLPPVRLAGRPPSGGLTTPRAPSAGRISKFMNICFSILEKVSEKILV
jgi:hypothetical protein